MKKKNLLSILIILTLLMSLSLFGCSNTTDKSDKWKEKFDISNPNIEGALFGKQQANEDGWYMTLNDDFNEDTLPNYWRPIKNRKRGNNTYWCDNTYSIENGNLIINLEKGENHNCGVDHDKLAVVTTCIDTSNRVDENGNQLEGFMQAFGYYEIRCKIPSSDGCWASFWLQNPNEGRIGDKGVDASEIDVFESSFFKNKTKVGSCIHYDGYANKHHSLGGVHDVGVNTYEGFHTYAVKWTPNEYVFYFDGKPTWATDGNGVCVTPNYLRLTCHGIDKGNKGPYAQTLDIKNFKESEFIVDYVKVYQNTSYESYIKSKDDFKV